MINVSIHILKFRKFLLDSWSDIDALMENHDWDNDSYFIYEWLQSNWEILVEKQLLKKKGILNRFGKCYREIMHGEQDVKISHEIVCLPKKGIILVDAETGKAVPVNSRLIFCIFLKREGDSRGLYPPFNYAGVFPKGGNKKIRYLVPVDDVEFFLDEVSRENSTMAKVMN